jgi:hypothetical protein
MKTLFMQTPNYLLYHPTLDIFNGNECTSGRPNAFYLCFKGICGAKHLQVSNIPNNDTGKSKSLGAFEILI